MFDKDASGRITRRFGAIQYVPSTISVRGNGQNQHHLSTAVSNEGKYNDFVPLVYGTAWYRPPIIFSRSDGNLTHAEVLLGSGVIDGIERVLVNGYEIPSGALANRPTATGWFNLVSPGERTGNFNSDFVSDKGLPLGDPYGSMGVLSVVIPDGLVNSGSQPKIDVLLRGLRCSVFDVNGVYLEERFTNNPAWVLLDVLRRARWSLDDLDLTTFAATASYCSEEIELIDAHGRTVTRPRFQCNLVLRGRKSAADVIRGIRTGSGLQLSFGTTGLLQLTPESSFAIQQSVKGRYSNSVEPYSGGWPAYEFGDGSNSFSDILRRTDGTPTVRLSCRSSAESPNRYFLEFQDEFNEFQQDSMSLVDTDDSLSSGYEVASASPALGVANFNQAARVLRLSLDKSVRGNWYIEFETGLRGIGLCAGDLITVTYLKEGLSRQPFRILRIQAGQNYATFKITAQMHDESWYVGNNGETGIVGGGRLPQSEAVWPRPLMGSTLNSDGSSDFSVRESYVEQADGSWVVQLETAFCVPRKASISALSAPVVSLSAALSHEYGTLKSGSTYYYALTAEDQSGNESSLSFLVTVLVPQGSESNRVALKWIRTPSATARINLYRGIHPARLVRIKSIEVSEGVNEVVDDGTVSDLAAAPDRSFDHAKFYWRLEYSPECMVEAATSKGLSSGQLELSDGEAVGKVVRITQGHGAGQERSVTSNNHSSVGVDKAWTILPDSTSAFVICESAWIPAAIAQQSPVVFSVPNRANNYIQITGSAANIHGRESSPELNPVTRHRIGGTGEPLEVPPVPRFGVSTDLRGSLEIDSIGFLEPHDLSSITGGTLVVLYTDEIQPRSGTLAETLVASGTSCVLAGMDAVSEGEFLLIGREVLQVTSTGPATLEVQRSIGPTEAADHPIGTPVYVLQHRTDILPFVKDYFHSPAAAHYKHSLRLPNARIATVSLAMSNVRGQGQFGTTDLTGSTDRGLRTHSGGQVSFNIEGPLAVTSEAAGNVRMDRARTVRDVTATLSQVAPAELGISITKNGTEVGALVIQEGTNSASLDGSLIPVFAEDSEVGVALTLIPADLQANVALNVRIRF